MKLQAPGVVTEILPPIVDRREVAGGEDTFSAIAAAGVVHDLGNLIQIASSVINILARTPNMPATHSGPMLDRARTSLEHAGALVRQNIGSIRDRAVATKRSDIAACMSDVAALIGTMDAPGLVLELDLEPNLPDACCDFIGLRRALLNLVTNARDAMAGEGIVLLRARAVPSGIELQVVDNGPGMSRETLARVFDPFFTTKTDGLGGIGLPMVERFARNGGGSVSIASEPGIGTIVTLRLPAIGRTTILAEESHS
jgi:signal transduction histidine kinase